MTEVPYAGPASGVTRVALAGSADGADAERAVDRLRTEPGLGAVVLGPVDAPRAVVTHVDLLRRAPRADGEPGAAWLRRLRGALVARGYSVELLDGTPVPGPRSGSPARAVARAGQRLMTTPLRIRVQRRRQRWWRWRFLLRLRFAAWLTGARLTIDVPKDFLAEPGIRLQLRPGRLLLQAGPRCELRSGVALRLGGELVMGVGVEIRYDVTLNVKGRLELQGRNALGRGAMVHADGHMVWEWGACCSEYVSVLDTDHVMDGALTNLQDRPVQQADVRIGAGALVGAKSTVLPGVRIGRASVIGANSVVTRDVPDGWVALGAPAKPVTQIARQGE